MAKETLYYGGTILPMTGETDRAEALLVRGGRITAAGSLAALSAAAPGARRVDLAGKCLLPAFIDPHSHILMAAQFAAFADLSACTCMDDIADALNDYKKARGIRPGEPIIGCNYDNNFLAENRHPDKTVLDRVSTENPIYIFHTSSHMGVANSKLLADVGYTADTPDPAGGHIGRMPGSNEPDGYLEEVSAFAPIVTKIFTELKMDLPAQFADAQRQYLSFGITTAQDGASGAMNVKTLAAFGQSGLLKLDVVSYVMAAPENTNVWEEYAPYVGHYRNRFKIGGLKTVLDGSPQGRTAWLSRPYEGSDNCAYPYMKDEALYAICTQALEKRLQLLAHCNGDAASEQFLTQYTRALKEHPDAPDLRPVMIHCQTVRDDQLDRMAEIGMLPSIFVGHTYYWGDVHLRNLGTERGSRVSPVKSALDRGMLYNFHQDTPVTKPNMLHSVWCAVNRLTRSGVSIGPEQAVSVYDALKGITCNAAYAYFEEDQKGTLEPGKLADLVVLGENPLSVDPMRIRDIPVLATIKEGEVVYGEM